MSKLGYKQGLVSIDMAFIIRKEKARVQLQLGQADCC